MNQEIKTELETRFSEFELAKLKYIYLCFLHEGSKFVLMLLIFSITKMQQEYLLALVVLLSIRNFSGGIHLKTYFGCLVFTFSFLLLTIIFSENIVFNYSMQNLILFFSILAMAAIGPITSSNRPALTQKQNIVYRSIGCTMLTFYFILFVAMKTFPYRNLCFWVIVFQILQLVVAKILKKGE